MIIIKEGEVDRRYKWNSEVGFSWDKFFFKIEFFVIVFVYCIIIFFLEKYS